MTLGEYMLAASKRGWEWGVHDCCAYPARWAGIELPTYSDKLDAVRMIDGAGGLDRLVEKWAGPALERVDQPEAGDVGIVELPAADALTPQEIELVQVGAIFTGERWSFVPWAGGIAAVRIEPMKVWRPVCRRP